MSYSIIKKSVLWIVFYAGTSSFLINYFSGDFSENPIWIPAGIGLALLLIHGWRFWPVILIAATIGEMGGGHHFMKAVSFAFGLTTGNLLAYFLLQKLGFNSRSLSFKDYFLLFLVGFLSAAYSSSIATFVLHTTSDISSDRLYSIFILWYLGDFFGVAFITPVILILFSSWINTWPTQKKISFIIVIAALFMVGQIIFFGWFSDSFDLFAGRGYILLLLFLPVAIYYGRQGAAILFVMYLIQASLGSLLGNGYFGPDLVAINAPIYIWTYLASMSVVGFFVSLTFEKLKANSQSLRESFELQLKTERTIDAIMNHAPASMMAFDLDLKRIEFINSSFFDNFGYSLSDISDIKNWWSLAYPNIEYREKVLYEWSNLIVKIKNDENNQLFNFITKVTCKNGLVKLISWRCFLTPENLVVYGEDISNKKKSDEFLRTSSLVYRVMGGAILVEDASGAIILVNEAFEALTGFTQVDLIGKSLIDLMTPFESDTALRVQIKSSIELIGRWEGRGFIRTQNGEEILRFFSIHSVSDESHLSSQKVVLISDVTDYRKAQELLYHQANHDYLTNLPNRRLILSFLDKQINTAKDNNKIIAVVYLDLDNFKEINDSRGHDFGDDLLISIGKSLRDSITEHDLIGRLGGDEFVILLNTLSNVGEVDAALRSIINSVSEPKLINGQLVYITASVGSSIFPTDGDDAKSLLLAADQAMYHAKSYGRNNYKLFSPTLSADATSRALMLDNLRDALRLNQFEIFYQPIIDLETDKIAHAEALLRWRAPSGELVFPSIFITQSEESGLILEISDWVMQQVLALLSNNPVLDKISLSINVSALQFDSHEHSILRWLDLIKSADIDPRRIIFEITERMMLNNSADVFSKVKMLQNAGCKFSIDDFGVGYSSLGTLQNFEFDYIKIDSQFIRDLGTSSSNASIVLAMISMSQALGLYSVAEGVENENQSRILKEAGCNFGQGYFYSEPLSRDEFIQFMTEGTHRGV